MNKAIQVHEVYDPTNINSRMFRFDLEDGQRAFMQIFIVPKSGLGESIPKKPTRRQTIEVITEAANTNINNYVS